MKRCGLIPRVLLVGAALAGCRSVPVMEARQGDLRYPEELVAERIRTRIEAAGSVADLRAGGEPVYESEVLPGFYERRLYRPAWSDKRGPTRLVDDLVGALRRADLEGLRSEDYHLAGIETVLAAVRADAKRGPAITPDRWAELDLLLTDAFLVYGTHLLAGRVNPETLRPEWVANRRSADVAVGAGERPGVGEDRRHAREAGTTSARLPAVARGAGALPRAGGEGRLAHDPGGVDASAGRPRPCSGGASRAAAPRGRPRAGGGARRRPVRRGARAGREEVPATPRPRGGRRGEGRDPGRAQRERGASRGTAGAEPRALALAASGARDDATSS